MAKLFFPAMVSPNFIELANSAADGSHKWEYPHLLPTVLAQWALESGWGSSPLAKRHKNYAGMKWRTALSPWAEPVSYTAHDGRTQYCTFKTDADFCAAFFARFDQIDLYDGWRLAALQGGEAFIKRIGPVWVGGDKAHGIEYVRKILKIQEDYFGA